MTMTKKLRAVLAIPGMLGIALAVPAAQADEAATMAAVTKAGCMACHAKDKKLVGPSFKDIAAKYKGKADVEASLMAKVRKGGSGVFGPIPMAPNGPDKISDKDLKEAVELILKS